MKTAVYLNKPVATVLLCLLATASFAHADIVVSVESSSLDRERGDNMAIDVFISSTTGLDTLTSFTLFLDAPGPGIELQTGIDFVSDIPWNFRAPTSVDGDRIVAAGEAVARFAEGSTAPGYRIGAASFGTSHAITATGDQLLASLQFDIAPSTTIGSYPLDFTFIDATGSTTFAKSNFHLPGLGSQQLNVTAVPEPSGFLCLALIATIVCGVKRTLRLN